MKWEVIKSSIASAEENMLKDMHLLEQLSSVSSPILRFYEWEKPSATYGHFISPQDFLCLEAVKKMDMQLARRPTGGGIIFHMWDLAFSVLVPNSAPFFSLNTLENYAFVNQRIAAAIKKFKNNSIDLSLFQNGLKQTESHFCMAKPTVYDLIVEGKKVGGAAQRKTKNGFLHQGTISLIKPCQDVLSRLILNQDILKQMNENSYPLLESPQELEKAKVLLRELITTNVTGNGI